MRQYLDAKREYADAVVFFRMGDFYEMFYEDAVTVSRVLDLTLTSRSKSHDGTEIPMCGVPAHAGEVYLGRLVKQGFRVAVCEQVEDARHTKGTKQPVRREIVRVVSPGTLTNPNDLETTEPVFLMALSAVGSTFGAALIDLSTGEFTAAEYSGKHASQSVIDEMAIIGPRELLVSSDLDLDASFSELSKTPVVITKLDPWTFSHDSGSELLREQLQVLSLDGFGLTDREAATMAAGALIHYLRDTQKVELEHVRSIVFRAEADHILIDPTTFSHLEIIANETDRAAPSVLGEINQTVTPMGGRLIRAWLQRPLNNSERVRGRLDAVEEFFREATSRTRFREVLKSIHDLERLVARVALGRAGPRELLALKESLLKVPAGKTAVGSLHSPLIRSLVSQLDEVVEVRQAIESTLTDDPPSLVRDGGIIRTGVNQELDDLRGISGNAKQSIAEMQQAERKRTGIASLKVGYNRVFGYYIEVSKSNLDAVPDEYHRKQTIANGERFITPELKEFEKLALGADDRILEMEQVLFEELRRKIAGECTRLQATAGGFAALDVLSSFAEAAAILGYTKPKIHDGDELRIIGGRHPVVERSQPDKFVPNDTLLNTDADQIVILTGPNMGGKSTYLRQVAVISLLAHAGCFVPAKKAEIPIVDRIFARVGASDNIARGESTFMVEMQETAKILHSATNRSLVILDEIGRGTATFDGLSIAWAVVETLARNSGRRPKTLFATHYHELTDLADSIPGVVNYHVVAKEWKEDILFLRKVELGRSDRSYGIQVARLAGLPQETVSRAKTILEALEHDELSRDGRPAFSVSTEKTANSTDQMGLFRSSLPSEFEVNEELRAIDVESITPLEAIALLAKLKKRLENS
tara:strand:- start:8957 stop:11572 length:2616 start_codon:yes stop_codon:yes gene_type:complete